MSHMLYLDEVVNRLGETTVARSSSKEMGFLYASWLINACMLHVQYCRSFLQKQFVYFSSVSRKFLAKRRVAAHLKAGTKLTPPPP
jgi:hypothetical protein